MSPSHPIALVIHGHFYQPPRENPWTDEVPREPSAAPFHDWNARIHAESYRANAFARIHAPDGRIQAIVNNYDRISYNFGPTLARWVAQHDPEAADRLRDADAVQRRRLGRGGAIAQAYAHPIVPLCNPRDRRTHLVWGLADFRRRFGREAEGLWLPETGVSPATLETLIELGVKFTILAPEQIAAVRPAAGEEGPQPWQAVDRDTVDTGRFYLWRHRDGSGRSIALAVFDGALSRAVAFGDAASRAESLLDAVRASADRSKVDGARLVLCASDGELWGHHKKFADLTLAFSTHVEAARRGIEMTNLAAHLARHPPAWEARLAEGPEGEGTAWSCAHGLGRWQRDCGCNMGGGIDWNQAWRTPLRRALDVIRDAAAGHYEDEGGDLFRDPWDARDAFGEVVDDPPEARAKSLAALGRPALAKGTPGARIRAARLLELQRATLLMYASCGWFFDDIAGLEASLVLRIGAHAMDLLRSAGGNPPTRTVLDILAEARSNDRESGTGADVYRRVAGHRVTLVHAVAGAAIHALVAGEVASPSGKTKAPRKDRPSLPAAVPPPGFEVAFEKLSVRGRALAGRARARHRRTGVEDSLEFLATRRGHGGYEVTVGKERLSLADLGDEARAAVVMAALPALLPAAADPAVAALLVESARELPPDGETPEGLERRAAFTRVLLAILGAKAAGAQTLRLAADLVDLLGLPPGSPQRRALEETVWALVSRGRPSAAVKAIAGKLGIGSGGAGDESKKPIPS